MKFVNLIFCVKFCVLWLKLGVFFMESVIINPRIRKNSNDNLFKHQRSNLAFQTRLINNITSKSKKQLPIAHFLFRLSIFFFISLNLVLIDLLKKENNLAVKTFLSQNGKAIIRMRGLPFDCVAQDIVITSHLFLFYLFANNSS